MKVYAYTVRQFNKYGPILAAAHVEASNPTEARAKVDAEFRKPCPFDRSEHPEFFDAIEAKRKDAIRTGFVVVVNLSKAKDPSAYV